LFAIFEIVFSKLHYSLEDKKRVE